jgi:hypothetical protein
VLVERYVKGWPRLAAEQNYFENRAIYRKFGYVLHRLLLRSLSRITELERLLEAVDRNDHERESPGLRSAFRPRPPTSDDSGPTDGGFEGTEAKDADEVLDQIWSQVREYCEFALQTKYQQLES